MDAHHESWLRVQEAAKAYDEALWRHHLAHPYVSALRRTYIDALYDFRLRLVAESRNLLSHGRNVD